jgi:hypothetical protein
MLLQRTLDKQPWKRRETFNKISQYVSSMTVTVPLSKQANIFRCCCHVASSTFLTCTPCAMFLIETFTIIGWSHR